MAAGTLFFVAFKARQVGMLSRNPRQTVWAVILGCGFVVVMFGLWQGLTEAVGLFGLFFSAGFPTVIEHFYSLNRLKVDEAQTRVMQEAMK